MAAMQSFIILSRSLSLASSNFWTSACANSMTASGNRPLQQWDSFLSGHTKCVEDKLALCTAKEISPRSFMYFIKLDTLIIHIYLQPQYNQHYAPLSHSFAWMHIFTCAIKPGWAPAPRKRPKGNVVRRDPLRLLTSSQETLVGTFWRVDVLDLASLQQGLKPSLAATANEVEGSFKLHRALLKSEQISRSDLELLLPTVGLRSIDTLWDLQDGWRITVTAIQ